MIFNIKYHKWNSKQKKGNIIHRNIKPILNVLGLSLLIAMPIFSYATNASNDVEQVEGICSQHHALMVRQDILNAGGGNGCAVLAPEGSAISKNCDEQVQAPAVSACGYTFYQDRTILACKAVLPAQVSDNTLYKYVLCRDLDKKDQLYWVRFFGNPEIKLPDSIKQDSPTQ